MICPDRPEDRTGCSASVRQCHQRLICLGAIPSRLSIDPEVPMVRPSWQEDGGGAVKLINFVGMHYRTDIGAKYDSKSPSTT